MKFLLTLTIIFFFPEAFAHEEHNESSEYRTLKEIQLKDGGQVYILAREDGHLLGQPYQVELRVRCHSQKEETIKLPIKDSFSVCDMSPESLKVNTKKTAVAMKVKMADINSYYEKVERGVASPEVDCAKPTTIKKP